MAPVVFDDHHRAIAEHVRAAQLARAAPPSRGRRADPGTPTKTAAGLPVRRSWWPAGAAPPRTSPPITVARSSHPVSRRLRRRAFSAFGSRSTNTAGRRPARQRLEPERAGPGEQVQHRPGGGPRMLKIASRTLAAVGRVRAPLGSDESPATIQPAGQSHEVTFLPRRTERSNGVPLTPAAELRSPPAEPRRVGLSCKNMHDATQ